MNSEGISFKMSASPEKRLAVCGVTAQMEPTLTTLVKAAQFFVRIVAGRSSQLPGTPCSM